MFEDPRSKDMATQIRRLAPSEANVLITGETGTGKELVARYIHSLSRRRDSLFVAVNCAALTETLAESELFGHERGAFTGAYATRAGWFETANGGTLFLDEIGELSLQVQVKLLRVLQEREVVRVGSRVPYQSTFACSLPPT
jgi:sigma-54-specific transcriptional regulator